MASKSPPQPASAGTAASASSAAVATSPSFNSPTFVRKTLTTVFIALLIDILAFTIILPLYPRILEYYEAVDGKDESSLYFHMRSQIQSFRHTLGVSSSGFDIILFGGALGSLFSFLQFISSPIIGSLSDAYGRRQVLLLSMVGNAVSMLLWIFSRSFGVFVCSRIVGGLTEGNVQMSIAVISDVTTAETRSKGLALVGIAFSLGFTVGPPLGAYFTSVDLLQVFPFLSGLPLNQYSSPALFAFVLIMIETAYLYVALPETRDYHKLATTTSTKTPSTLASTATATATRKTRDASVGPSPAPINGVNNTPTTQRSKTRINTLSTVHFLFLFFFSGMEFTLTFLTHDRFAFTHARQGRLLAFIGVLSALVQGGYTRRIHTQARFTERGLVAQGIAAASLGLAILGFCAVGGTNDGGGGGVWWLYAGCAFLAFTSGTVVTGLTALASYETGARKDNDPNDDAVGEYEEVGSGDSRSREKGGGGDRGRVLGRFRSVGQLGRALGPLFACTTYWVFGSRCAYGFGAGAMACVACATWMFAPAGAAAAKRRAAATTTTTAPTTTWSKKEL
ncbi:major facilitator superfamily domain-containing protein [Geranomyces variabilis]|nr:major facilitator superfamily domain-containing protein [Geranomyces variabilis]KAJ3140288.1 hypothetical protein HDU90_008516 [Geranomyces variabilis]